MYTNQIKNKRKLSDEALKIITGDVHIDDDTSVSKNEDKTISPQLLKYDPPTDDELLELAKLTYSAQKDQSISDLTSSVENKKKSLYESINDQIASSENLKKEKTLQYDTATKNLENQALKRGIQRSSASVLGLKDLEVAKINALNNIDSNLKNDIEKLNTQIDTLESDFSKQLSKIDDKYANAIQVKLQDLKKQRDDKLTEVIKYNNQLLINHPEIDFNQKVETSDDEDVISFPTYNAVKDPVISTDDIQKVNAVVKKFLSYSNPVQAFKEFQEESYYEKYLGDYYNNVYHILLNNAKATK